MNLTLFPRPETRHDTMNDLPRGMTHAEGTPCPFDDGHPIDPSATCCAFPAQPVVDVLKMIGEDRVAERLFQDLDETAALLTVYLLRTEATIHQKMHREVEADEDGESSGRMVNLKTGHTLRWTRPELEAAIASIHQLADWYEKVSRLGFGVRARY